MRLRSVGRAAFHAARAMRSSQSPRRGDVVVLLVNPAHARIFESVGERLDARGIRTFLLFESHARGESHGRRRSGRLVDQLTPRRAAGLLAFESRTMRALSRGTRDFEELVGAATAQRMRVALSESIGRIALYAACLDAVATRGPSVLAAFNEIGRWSRILPVVARRHGVPSLDIAHAEPADHLAVQGTTYDHYAVFGPRSTSVLVRAGLARDRIHEVGAPRFDALIARHPDAAAPPGMRRIVFASQWLTGAMTEHVKERTIEAVLAVASAVAPCDLVFRRHPIESDMIAERVIASTPHEGVSIRIEGEKDLYADLDGAWLLITGWSNTVFEAALSNVPALCINMTGQAPPMPFVTDGLALGVDDEPSAITVARSLLIPRTWLSTLHQARAAITEHLGPLDGKATERLTTLIEALGRRDGPAGHD